MDSRINNIRLFLYRKGGMDIKDRVKSYEPLFNQWLFEELVEIHDQESLIKIKHQAIGVEKTALLKIITLYDQDNN